MSLTINFTSADFASILNDIQTRLIANDPLWNDWLASNTGRMMVEMFAAIADMNRFSIDRQAAETYITDVQLRNNAAKIVALIGFQPSNPVGMQTTAKFTLTSAWPRTITIPKWTLLQGSTIPGVTFATSAAITIGIGTVSASVIAVQGVPATTVYVSNGQADQIVQIPVKNIYEGSVNVSVSGVAWTLAPFNFLVGTQPADQVFSYRNMADGTVQVLLGDGVEGTIPLAGANLVITYLLTQGINVTAGINQIGTIVGTIVDSSSITVTGLSVSNIDSPAGAADYENAATIAANYPLRFSALRRAVTLGDFQAFAQTYPGVIQAQVYDANTLSSLPPFEILVYAAATPIGATPSALLSNLQAYLTSLASVDTIVVVQSVTAIPVNVAAGVFVFRNFSSSSVLANVQAAVQSFFTVLSSNSHINIGQNVFTSQLITVMQQVPGVSAIDLTIPVSDVVIAAGQIATLGTLNITLSGLV